VSRHVSKLKFTGCINSSIKPRCRCLREKHAGGKEDKARNAAQSCAGQQNGELTSDEPSHLNASPQSISCFF